LVDEEIGIKGMADKAKKNSKSDSIDRLEKQISSLIDKYQEKYQNTHEGCICYPLLVRQSEIGPRLVDDVYEQLLDDKYKCESGKLVVIVDSSGGDIDAAYNLASLFQDIGHTYLEFVIPRWAKSAATLLCCAADKISMTSIAELGPVDPQITVFNPLEKRMEQFSPLHIDSTFTLIRKEYDDGNNQMADKLMERLQFPLTLGSFKKIMEVSKGYLETLLTSRMLKDNPQKAKEIAQKLSEGYADHGACINAKEAKNIGLNVDILNGETREIVWKIHKLLIEQSNIIAEQEQEQMKKKIKELPPGLIDETRTSPQSGGRK
jgi:ClpP class serine protease